MKTNNVFFTMLVVIAISPGCETFTRYEYVVLRAVPESPSVTVVPANNYLVEVAFANNVEHAIIRAGIKVVQRPATKEVTTERTMAGARSHQNGSDAAIESGEAKQFERYIVWEDIDTDYVVRTYFTFGQIRIIKQTTREVLAVVICDSEEPWKDKLREVFIQLGF